MLKRRSFLARIAAALCAPLAMKAGPKESKPVCCRCVPFTPKPIGGTYQLGGSVVRWTGATGNADWNDPNNWDPPSKPEPCGAVRFSPGTILDLPDGVQYTWPS